MEWEVLARGLRMKDEVGPSIDASVKCGCSHVRTERKAS